MGRRGGRQVRERRLRRLAAVSSVDNLPSPAATAAELLALQPLQLVNNGGLAAMTTKSVEDGGAVAARVEVEAHTESALAERAGEIRVGTVVVLQSPCRAPPPPNKTCSLPSVAVSLPETVQSHLTAPAGPLDALAGPFVRGTALGLDAFRSCQA
ncbi:hypothetical protein QYE76_001126 [Lolium multiflorum]|uniref:Uncharacterized protein n=1 Tax=Lolium multiflorum TaxID=4521 RepID=A0AAD8RIW6_LOLMU|nr:hypothetical protein QYE76_001126 [Lolium multiflorum]